ncbi:MAG TPA: alpha/beta hydrolase [Acidimicrobiia bacterium]
MVSQPIEDLPPRHDVPARGRSGFVRLGGRQVHFLEWGHARRPAVVCLHGGGQTAYMFEELGRALADRYHVLAWDSADHGDSDPFDGPAAENPIDRHALAADAVPLCAEFGIDRAVFVGASMGGIVSVTLAAARPDLVGGVVLLDVGHRLEVAGVQRIAAFMSEHESFADLDEAAAAIAGYLPGRTVTTGRLTRNLRQRPDGRWVWKHGLGRRIRAREGIVDAEQGGAAVVAGLDDDLRGLQRPVLVLRGSKSDVLSEAGADELVDLLPDARYARIQGAGHLAAGDNPESFVGLVSRFLDEIAWADGGLNTA